MIYIDKPIYATFWKGEKNQNGSCMKVEITTGAKTTDGSYRNSRWYARAITKQAIEALGSAKPGDRIVINKSKWEEESYTTQEGKRKYNVSYLLLEVQPLENDRNAERAEQSTTQIVENSTVDTSGDDCPW